MYKYSYVYYMYWDYIYTYYTILYIKTGKVIMVQCVSIIKHGSNGMIMVSFK